MLLKWQRSVLFVFIVQGNLQGNPLFRDGGKQWMYEPEWASLKQYPHVCIFRVHLRGNLPPPSTPSLNFPLCHSGVYTYIAPSLAGQMFGGLREHLVTLGRIPWPLPKSWQGQSNCTTSQNVILSCDKAYIMYWTMAARAIDKYCWICSWLLTVTSLRYTEL